MPQEPHEKRCIAYVDAQSLFHAARQAFGCYFPDYDPLLLCQTICERQGWTLSQVRAYTSLPSSEDNEYWHHFWMNKLRELEKRGAITWWRPWRFRRRPVRQADGRMQMMPAAVEKGVDLRLALDILQAGHARTYDVALVLSQDQDFAEVADEIRHVARLQERWIKIASAYPYSSASRTFRGIDRTDWIQIDQNTYNACLDPNDYRPKRGARSNFVRPDQDHAADSVGDHSDEDIESLESHTTEE